MKAADVAQTTLFENGEWTGQGSAYKLSRFGKGGRYAVCVEGWRRTDFEKAAAGTR
jgi:hypothetical protein